MELEKNSNIASDKDEETDGKFYNLLLAFAQRRRPKVLINWTQVKNTYHLSENGWLTCWFSHEENRITVQHKLDKCEEDFAWKNSLLARGAGKKTKFVVFNFYNFFSPLLFWIRWEMRQKSPYKEKNSVVRGQLSAFSTVPLSPRPSRAGVYPTCRNSVPGLVKILPYTSLASRATLGAGSCCKSLLISCYSERWMGTALPLLQSP